MPAHPPELRPYRVAMYILFFGVTLTFIGLVFRSIWIDLYGATLPTGQPTVTECADRIEKMNRTLETRLSGPLAPSDRNWERFEAEWSRFTKSFDEDLRFIQARCIDEEPRGGTSGPAFHDAMAASADRLDTLRQHLARCGMDGERERESVASALAQLRATVHRTPR